LRAADCDTDHNLVVANVRVGLEVSKQEMHKFHIERLNLKKLNEVEDKEHFRVEISDRFATLENLDSEVDIQKPWENRENFRISAKDCVSYFDVIDQLQIRSFIFVVYWRKKKMGVQCDSASAIHRLQESL
jgi:hypothetical protein